MYVIIDRYDNELARVATELEAEELCNNQNYSAAECDLVSYIVAEDFDQE